MGDRVAFIGGKTVERDHFPFLVADSSGADAGYYPVAVDIATAMQWFWLPQTWSVDGSAAFVAHGRYGSSHTFTALFGDDLEDTTATRGRESDLVTFGELYGEAGGDIDGAITHLDLADQLFDEDVDFGSGHHGHNYFRFQAYAEFGVFFWPMDGSFNFQPKALWDGGLIRPVLWVHFFFSASYRFTSYSGGPDPITDIASSSRWLGSANFFANYGGGSANAADQTVYVTATGISLKRRDVVDVGGTAGDFSLTHSSHDLTIAPGEFFPYATKDGLPVYDTVTGAILNDPLS